MRISKMIRLRPKEKVSYSFYIVMAILFTSGAFLGFVLSDHGNFSMDMDDIPPYDIKISEEITFQHATTRLSVTSYVDLNPVDFDDLDLNQILNQEGQYIDVDHPYLAYSFYLKNQGSMTTDINYYLRFFEVTYWMQDALRILLIEDDLSYTIYQKDESEIKDITDIDILSFMSESMVFRHEIKGLKTDEVKHFRVIMWLDQAKIDQELVQPGHSLKLIMTFQSYYRDVLNQSILSLDVPKNLWISINPICNIEFTLLYQIEDES